MFAVWQEIPRTARIIEVTADMVSADRPMEEVADYVFPGTGDRLREIPTGRVSITESLTRSKAEGLQYAKSRDLLRSKWLI